MDKLLRWLVLYEMAEYINLTDGIEKATPVQLVLLDGLTELLGEEGPLTLRVKADLTLVGIVRSQMRKALSTWVELAAVQKTVAGTEIVDYFQTLQYAGLASVYVTEYVSSQKIQEEAASDMKKISGATSYNYLCCRLYMGYALTGLGLDQEAFDIFDEVYTTGSGRRGPETP